RSRGFGVPIAVSLLLAIAPIILLFQQNRLIAIQGNIAANQTKLMELQTLAARSDQSRQLYSQYQEIIDTVARLKAALSVYDQARNLRFKVKGRAPVDNLKLQPPRFDQSVTVRDYDLDLCGNGFPQSLRHPGWLESSCRDTEPIGEIRRN